MLAAKLMARSVAVEEEEEEEGGGALAFVSWLHLERNRRESGLENSGRDEEYSPLTLMQSFPSGHTGGKEKRKSKSYKRLKSEKKWKKKENKVLDFSSGLCLVGRSVGTRQSFAFSCYYYSDKLQTDWSWERKRGSYTLHHHQTNETVEEDQKDTKEKLRSQFGREVPSGSFTTQLPNKWFQWLKNKQNKWIT